MSEFELVVRGGEVVTAADKFRADVGVRGGKIVAIADKLTDGARVIDASGLLVMPGGIDSHVHFAQPAFGGPKMADGFETGTRSAIAGGNTTVLPFALQPRGASLRASVMDYHKEADGNSYCDYGFHLIVTDPTPSVLGQELPALVADGYSSFKVFMTYDDLVLNDRQLLEVFDCARGCGALVMVHCEGYDAIKFMTQRLEAAGKTAPYYHAVSRPEVVEREATHRAISHGELLDTPIMIVHVSGREAMEQIRWAQRRGLKVYGETCTQYVSLTADDLKGLNMDESGGKYVCSPPPRDRASWEAIWEGIRTGVFQTFSSDHCPFFYEGVGGQAEPEGAHLVQVGAERHPRRRGAAADPLFEGRRRGPHHGQRIRRAHRRPTTPRCTASIRTKGAIGVGFDADIVLWDPNKRETIRQEIMHHGADYTPYEGMAVTGWPVVTMLRGKVVAEDGKIVGEKGGGQFLKRDLSPYATPAGRTIAP